MSGSWHALCVATALACGLLIGVERGFDLRGLQSGTRIAGVRTFTLAGLVSGLAGLAGAMGQAFAGGALVCGAVAVVAIGYAHRPGLSKRPDATTPMAALATIGLGFTAGIGQPGFAIAGATVVTLLLALKAELHGLLDKLDQARLSNQQQVVRSERRENIESVPYGLSHEAVYRNLFPEGHPYHAAVIGSHEDIQPPS